MLFKNIKIVDSDYNVKSGMYVKTDGPIITYVGDKCPEDKGIEEEYDGTNKIMLPSFYNVHCHVPMTILRGYGEGLDLHRWLNEKIFPFEAKLNAKDVYWSTKLGVMELIASGCASISDMYFFIEDMARSIDECGMKANICHGISTTDENARLEDIKGYKDTISLYSMIKDGVFGGEKGTGKNSRIRVDMGLHAEYTSCENLVKQIAERAAEEKMTVHVHVSETAFEHEECKKRHRGLTPVRYFDRCGLFKTRVQAAHCVYIDDDDADIMKANGAFMVHNPSSNLKLGSGIAAVPKMFASGLNIALGTDGASSNNNLNMLEEIHVAAIIARGITKDANALKAADVLKMASLNGALSQGRTDCGRIEKGMRADLIVMDLDKPHMQPDYDTISNIVFSAQASDIVLNMIDGDIVYRDGEFKYIDKERVIFETKKSFNRIVSEV